MHVDLVFKMYCHCLQQFLRAIDDENIWISEAEALLTSEDVGKDLPSVQFLLKKHQVLYSVVFYIVHPSQCYCCKSNLAFCGPYTK